jgi:TolB-like protein/Flp pilus assembly protein TadD
MSDIGQTGAESKLSIFLSYSSADRTRIKPIVEALQARGYSVWWDRDIAGGAAYARAIEAALKASQVVVVAWSKSAAESDWVRDEAAFGRDRTRLVPLQLDQTEPPLGFRQYQLVRMGAGKPSARQIEALVSAIEASAAAGPPHDSHVQGAAPRLDRRRLLVGAAVAVPVVAVGGWWLLGRGAAAPPAHSIAVLPLANLSGQPSEDYFSDGLSEELINALARLKPLEVVARTSAFRFKGSKAGAKEIGAKLGVAYILDGSVRRDGTLVRISTTLAEARTGFERWSQTFDRELKDILAVQSEIAQAVAEALKVRLLGADIAAFSLGGAANAEAYDAYLRGRRLFDRGGSEANYRAALAQFDTAIAADPAFSAAHAARARALMSIANQYTPPERLRATFDASLKSARRAVALTPDLAEAQATLAGVLTNANFDFAGAKAVWARAMVTGSGDADILYRYGQFSCEIGDFGPGLPAVRRATVLDPLNPRAFRALGYALFGARLYTETIAAMRQSLALSPSSEGAHAAIADALMLTGDLAGAGREYALEPLDWLRLTGQAILRRRMGDAPGAEAALKALMGDDAGVTLYQQAQVYAQWGQTDRALTALEVAYKGRDSGIVLMKADPMVDPLRREPRFIRLLGQLGLA